MYSRAVFSTFTQLYNHRHQHRIFLSPWKVKSVSISSHLFHSWPGQIYFLFVWVCFSGGFPITSHTLCVLLYQASFSSLASRTRGLGSCRGNTLSRSHGRTCPYGVVCSRIFPESFWELQPQGGFQPHWECHQTGRILFIFPLLWGGHAGWKEGFSPLHGVQKESRTYCMARSHRQRRCLNCSVLGTAWAKPKACVWLGVGYMRLGCVSQRKLGTSMWHMCFWSNAKVVACPRPLNCTHLLKVRPRLEHQGLLCWHGTVLTWALGKNHFPGTFLQNQPSSVSGHLQTFFPLVSPHLVNTQYQFFSSHNWVSRVSSQTTHIARLPKVLGHQAHPLRLPSPQFSPTQGPADP